MIFASNADFFPFRVDKRKCVLQYNANFGFSKYDLFQYNFTESCSSKPASSWEKPFLAATYFDFFKYAGIQRSVYLVTKPQETIIDYDTAVLQRQNQWQPWCTCLPAGCPLQSCSKLYHRQRHSEGRKCQAMECTRCISLYIRHEIHDGGQAIDQYCAKHGIRTIEIQCVKILACR